MKTYHLNIITPDGKVFDDTVEAIVAPGETGSFGVLSGHIALLSLLKNGILKITQNTSEIFYTIGSGMLEFNANNQCLILVDEAKLCKSREEAAEQLLNT